MWGRREWDDPDVTDLRDTPAPAAGHSPGRIFLAVLLFIGLVVGWMVIPFSSLFGGFFSGFGKTQESPGPIATPLTDTKDLDRLASHHVPTPPPPPPLEPKPPMAVPDDWKAKYDWLAQQYADLEARLTGQPKATPPPSPKKDIPSAVPVAKPRPAERKTRGEPIFLTRAKDDKLGKTYALKSPYSLAPSEVIEGLTSMAISSDTPGAFVVVVSKDVPDTATRTHNVLPKGSKFVVRPRGKLIFGDERIDVETQTLTFPGGSWLKMVKHTLTDRSGVAGITGEVDHHYGRLFASILLTGVLRGGSTLATGGYSGDAGDRIGGAIIQEGASAGTREVRQQMRTDPTISVANGYTVRILLEDELVLTRSFGKYVP